MSTVSSSRTVRLQFLGMFLVAALMGWLASLLPAPVDIGGYAAAPLATSRCDPGGCAAAAEFYEHIYHVHNGVLRLKSCRHLHLVGQRLVRHDRLVVRHQFGAVPAQPPADAWAAPDDVSLLVADERLVHVRLDLREKRP